jgi:hypothetical protein
LECTYVEAAKRRGPPKGYLDTLEHRCGRLERLLMQLYPTLDVAGTVGPTPDRDDFDLSSYQDTLRSLGIPPYPALKPVAMSDAVATPPNAQNAPSPSPRVLGPAPWQSFEKDPNRPADDEEEARDQARIAHALTRLNINDHDAFRFHGKASGAHLVRIVNELKYDGADLTFFDRLNTVKRPEYWMVPEWEKVIATDCVKSVQYESWPPEDLAARLIDGYFDMVNIHMPLLNRVIFQRQYQSGLWRTNPDFARMCLMMFANGARYIDDERVYWPTDDATTTEGRERLRTDKDGTRKYSAGWIYMRAVMNLGRSWLQGPSLLDLQTHVLGCLFLNGSTVPHLAWIVAGAGLRMAQEMGIHVRSTMLLCNPIDRALYSRAFWCLYHFDRLSCSAIGRSVAIQDSDFDADYPMLVDDEYWDTGDPERDFRQPPGLLPDPALVAFTHLLKLDHVLGAAMRTIYAVNRLPEHGADQRAIVVELDSALNSWADTVPDSLRWDPTRSDPRLFEHSAVLYAHYYYVQVLIHRPFIPTRRHPESVGFPSLAICSNAARSISNILDAVLRRGRQSGRLPGHAVSIAFALPASTAAIVLLMNVYAVRQRPQERERCMNDVRRVIAALREMELTYRQAGKMTDLISEVARESTGETLATTPITTPSMKRSYDDVEETAATANPGTPGAPDHGPLQTATIHHAQAHASYTPGAPPMLCMSEEELAAGSAAGPSTPVGGLPVPPVAAAAGVAAAAAAGGMPPAPAPGAGTPFDFQAAAAAAAASDIRPPGTSGPPTPPYGVFPMSWGTGMTPTGEATLVPDLFEPGDLQNLNYAVTNFDLMGDTSAPDFWAGLFRQGISGGVGVGTMGTGLNNGQPSAQAQQQQPWNFMPWLQPEGQ